MENKQSKNELTADNLMVLLWSWRKWIIIMVTLTIIGSAVVSLLIREKYRSTAIIFPSKSSTVVLGEMLNPSQSITAIGEEEEAEQLLQILNSSEIRDFIINKYNLMKHYDIDAEGDFAYTNLVREYNSNVTCERTRHNSITIDVLDYNPDTAAFIANDIARLVDSTKNRMIRERSMKAFEVIEKEYLSLKRETEELRDSLTKLSKMGVIASTEGQAKLIEAYTNAIAQRNTTGIAELSKQLEVNREFAPIYRYFDGQLEQKTERLAILENAYQQSKAETEMSIPHKFTLETARPAERKDYPVRWLIVVMSTIGSFLFMIGFIVVFEKIKQIRSTIN